MFGRYSRGNNPACRPRAERAVGQRLITPGLGVVLLAGIYLASKLHAWSAFYVQWGLGVAIVLGALGGMFFAPTEKRLAELADTDEALDHAPLVVRRLRRRRLDQRRGRVETTAAPHHPRR